ncbi:MAG: FixH family protein [Pseudomonadota bacterium]
MSETIRMKEDEGEPRWQLTGRHVLLLMVGFFGVIIATSVVFTTLAVTSFRGEDVKRSYRQGLDYNTTLDARSAQSQLGWTAQINIVDDRGERMVVVQLTDADGVPLSATEFVGRLRHPVDSTLDHKIDLDSQGDGIARANLTGLLGQWTLEVSATRGEDHFAFRRDIDLR